MVRKMSDIPVRNVGDLHRTMDGRIYVKGIMSTISKILNTKADVVYYRVKDVKIEGNTLPLKIVIELEVEKVISYGI